MTSIFSKSTIHLIAIALAASITACGGDSGGTTGSSGGASYSGNTSQATITVDNAGDFGLSVIEGAEGTSGLYPFSTDPNTQSGKKAQRAAMMKTLTELAKAQVTQIINNSGNNISTTASTTYNGTCGGTAVYTDNSNYGASSGNIDITFTYNNFCNGGLATYGFETVQDGSMTITGTYSIPAGATLPVFQSMTLNVPSMSLTVTTNSGSTNETFSGTITVTFDSNGEPVTLSITMDFNVDGIIFRIENYVVDTSNNMLTINGRFYHPIHGYVDITTTEPFDLYSTSPDQYCSGTIEIAGNGGTAAFTADATCSTYEVCYTPTGGTATCNTHPWP